MKDFVVKLLNHPIAKWLVLFLLGMVLFSNYYFYDAFSTLKGDMTLVYGFSNTDYGIFSSFYSVPNTFLMMAVIGGIILDRIGIRRTGFMFISFMVVGALLTAYGASDYYREGGLGFSMMDSFLPDYSPCLKMMLLGRLFFGLGAETSIVVISKALVRWFKGKNLALAFGFKVGFGRLGTFAALNLTPRISEEGLHLSWAIWVAAIFVSIGLLVFIFFMLLDKQKQDDTVVVDTDEKKSDAHFKISDIGKILMNPSYIFIALLCVTFYSAVFPFMQYAPDFFMNKYGMTSTEAGLLTSIIPISTAFFTPLFGFLFDRFGKGATAMIFGSVLLSFVHLSFAFTTIPAWILLSVLGIVFSLVPAALWPTMVRLVPEKIIGTAYGLTYSIQNWGLLIFPILAGMLLDDYNQGRTTNLDYTAVLVMFAGLGVVGLLFALLLKRYDKKKGVGLDLPLNSK